jgi:septin family protein
VVDTLDNIEGNYASALEHVPVAERNNRTQQERVRATFYSPIQSHLEELTIWLVEECARKLNYFPVKG